MIIPKATDIATHKFYIASAKSCRIRLVEPGNSGEAAAALGTLGRWGKAIVNSQVAPR